MEDEQDPVTRLRMDMVKDLQKSHPILGQFSPEQWAKAEASMGAVFVPSDDFQRHQKFTNLKSRHIRALFRAGWMLEVREAAHEGRRLDVDRIIANVEKALGDINGWLANMYLRTGLEALRANERVPGRKLGFWEKRRMKKQGGW